MASQELHDISTVSGLCELAMTSSADITNIAERISRIDDCYRPRPLRKADRRKVESILTFWRNMTLRDLRHRGFKDPEVSVANKKLGNFSASDLIASDGTTFLNIETKFGAATNANIGLERMSSILGVPAFSLDKGERTALLSSLSENGCDSVFVKHVLEHLQKRMNEHVQNVDWSKVKVDGAFVRDMVMSSGAAGNSRTMNGDYVMYLYKRRAFEFLEPSLVGNEEWVVHPMVGKTASSVRLSYHMVEKSTGDHIKAIFNNKNSTYVRLDGEEVSFTSDKHANGVIRVPSRLQLGVPSYNVWYKANKVKPK